MPEVSQRPTAAHTFQVDLRGLVDLLSHHLYSSPRVYLRELLQNGVDAITARQRTDPAAPGWVRVTVERAGLRVEDPGIGLAGADVHRFLATIGRSSKRDTVAGVEVARRDFLGQFGIGLLACFLVADAIEVTTRSATDPAAAPVRWLASADGSYTVTELDPAERPEPGTTVRLTARPGTERWLAADRVAELAAEFGSLLPVPVTVVDGDTTTAVNDTPPVWERGYPTTAARWQALVDFGKRALGFAPMDAIDLDVPLAGVRGVAYVLPHAASPSARGGHRVYLKGMLLSDAVDGLLPEWAFFARCVLTTDTLRPTASREGLYQDETLAAVREALGGQLRDWLTGLAAEQPERLRRFLAVHRLGVKALACHDSELLRIMLPWLPFETTAGTMSLTEFTRTHRVVHLAATVEEFRQVAPIAAAQGLGVVNGGYTYDSDLVRALPAVLPGVTVEDLAADVVVAHLDRVDPAVELPLAGFLATARARLDQLDCDVALRAFHPVSVPALYLDSRDARQERVRAQTEAEADELWSEILSSLRSTAPRAQLVLNQLSPLLRRIATLPDPDLVGSAVEAIYGQALLMTHRPLRAAETALLNRAFGDLLQWAARSVTTPTSDEEPQP